MATPHDATLFFASQAPPWNMCNAGGGFVGVVQFHVDMAKVKTYVAGTISGAASDTVPMWAIPAGTLIQCVRLELITPEGATTGVTVGDATQAAGWNTSFSLNGVAGTHVMTLLSDEYGKGFGISYDTTTNLVLTFSGDTDIAVAVFKVQVGCVIFRRYVTPIW